MQIDIKKKKKYQKTAFTFSNHQKSTCISLTSKFSINHTHTGDTRTSSCSRRAENFRMGQVQSTKSTSHGKKKSTICQFSMDISHLFQLIMFFRKNIVLPIESFMIYYTKSACYITRNCPGYTPIRWPFGSPMKKKIIKHKSLL